MSLFSQVSGYRLTKSGDDSVLDPATGADASVRIEAGRPTGPLDAGFVATKVGDQVGVTVDVANLSNVTELLNATVNFPAGLTPGVRDGH